MKKANERFVAPVAPPNPLSVNMTLRDWFAGQAITAIYVRGGDPYWIAKRSYAMADAMLAQRTEPLNPPAAMPVNSGDDES